MKIDKRYKKNLGTIGADGQARLARSQVAIAGAGGLGGTVFEILVRAGAGRITIADFDRFDETNLNRQLLATERTLGRSKAASAAERAGEVNSGVEVVAVQARITDANAENIFAGADIICDCLGNIKDRFAIERAARKLGVPMVHAAVAGQRGQIMVVYPDGPGLEAIYGSESEAPASGEEFSLGTPPASVMAIAAMQAGEAVRIITGTKAPPGGELARIDLQTLTIERFRI